jgi:DNA-binding NarL/FixJ family response regulator
MHAALAAGRFGEGADLWRQLLAQLDGLRPSMRIPVRVSLCAAAAFNFDPREAAALAEHAEADTPFAGLLATMASVAHYRSGRFADVETSTTARDELAAPDGGPTTGLWLMSAIAARVERADPSAAELVALAERTPRIAVLKSGVDVARAMWHRANGEHAAAAVLAERAVDRERRRGQVNFLAMALAASVAAAVDRGDDAVARRDNEALQALDDSNSIAITMDRLHAQALVHADADAAAAALEHARRHGLAADAARDLGLLGALTADAGALGDAYRELGELGAVWRQRAVAHDLRRLGRRVPHAPPSSADLSPVEIEVVSLVSAGLTNRQVAERMGLSPKTVEVYLSRIYVKTGRRSRVELAVARLEPQSPGVGQ